VDDDGTERSASAPARQPGRIGRIAEYATFARRLTLETIGVFLVAWPLNGLWG
jgi:hypothetical protein